MSENKHFTTESDIDFSDIYIDNYTNSYITLCNKNIIENFYLKCGSSDVPDIMLNPDFSNDTKIHFICSDMNAGIKFIILEDGSTLNFEQISRFTITDAVGNTYTLDDTGTITKKTE